MDVRVRNFSRIVEIITVGLLMIAVILNFSPVPKLALVIVNSFILASQVLVILYILIDNSCIACTYLSAQLGFGVALITLVDRLFEVIHFAILNKKDKLAITNIY
jgi:hypothetical protein